MTFRVFLPLLLTVLVHCDGGAGNGGNAPGAQGGADSGSAGTAAGAGFSGTGIAGQSGTSGPSLGGQSGTSGAGIAGGVAGTSAAGVGGAAGESGSAGAGGCVEGIPCTWHGWLTDEALWTPVAGAEQCWLYQGDVANIPYVPRTWESCGDGCLVAPIFPPLPMDNLGTKARVTVGNMAGYFEDGRTLVRVSVLDTVGKGKVTILDDLETGQLRGAIAHRGVSSECYSRGGREAPRVLALTYQDKLLVALFDGMGGVEWNAGLSSPGSQHTIFEWDAGWGMTMASGDVILLNPPSSSSFAVLDSTAPMHSVDARKKFIGWPGWEQGTSVVKGYTQATGAQLVKAYPGDAQAQIVALTNERFVYVVTHGPEAFQGSYTAAELYSVPLVDSIPSGEPVQIAALPANIGLTEMRAWGDFAVMDACDSSLCGHLLVRLSDGYMWKFDDPPGCLLGNLLGMSDSEIMFAVPKDSDHTRIERLVRLDLTKIDAWSVQEWE